MIRINLHPAAQKAARERRKGIKLTAPAWMKGEGVGRDRWTLALVACAILVVLFCGALFFRQRALETELSQQLDAATADSARLADLRVLSDSLTAREKQIQDRVALVRRLDNNRFVWPHVMAEVSHALPRYAWLTGIKESSPLPNLEVQLQGVAASPLVITDFVSNLQQSPYFSEVRIVGTQKQVVDELTAQAFTLVVHYSAPPEKSERRPITASAGGN